MAKILLIDDSTFARTSMKRILGEQYSYVEASDGLSGLEAYFIHHPDLVILDITLPGTGGLEILEQIRRLDDQAKIVICSADIQEFSRSKAHDLGALAFIGKPINPSDLLPIVRPILEQAGG